MKAVVRCEVCDEEIAVVGAPTYRDLCFALQAALVSAHAEHTLHRLSFRIDDSDGKGDTLHIACTAEGCRHPMREQTWHGVPIELVGAYVLTFHTAHEGHPLRVTYGGREWASPTMDPTHTRR